MTFDKKEYWKRRKKGFRGQKPGTHKEHTVEQHSLEKLAYKLYLKKRNHEEAGKEIHE